VTYNLDEYQFAPPVLGRRPAKPAYRLSSTGEISSAGLRMRKKHLPTVLWKTAANVLHKPRRKGGGAWDLSRLPDCCILAGLGEEEAGYAGVQPAKQ
jgi:hypothetical protein